MERRYSSSLPLDSTPKNSGFAGIPNALGNDTFPLAARYLLARYLRARYLRARYLLEHFRCAVATWPMCQLGGPAKGTAHDSAPVAGFPAAWSTGNRRYLTKFPHFPLRRDRRCPGGCHNGS